MSKQESGKSSSAAAVLAAGAVASHAEVPKERAQFRALLVGNPNYFGNVAAGPFAPVFAIKGNPTYEEIKCVGFHPQSERLDAVVFVKQAFGYGGNVCSTGTPEYIRFYISFDGGTTWVDQGLTSFIANDVPASATGGRRLEYAASVPCNPPRRWCVFSNVIRARAILSWNNIPPPNTPDHVPVWGNVHDTNIQVDPTWFIKWLDIFKLANLKLAPGLASSIDLEQTVAAAPKKALGFAELRELYRDKGVEPHRYAMAEVKQLIKTPEFAALGSHPLQFIPAKKLGFELSDVIAKLLTTDGSTVYEELDCVGLRPSGFADELVGVLRIKRGSGYSGGPCTQGSREYVTFWADFNNNGTYETCLGTASVQVFDLDVPREGLEYSVHLPVDLNPYRKPCGSGPRVVPIRAILSWGEAPDCGNPNWVPTWGNREDTQILIAPGNQVNPGDFSPYLYDVSGAAVCAIDQGSGRAAGRPFGGTLCITGEIPGALGIPSADTLEYRVWATQGATTVPLVTPFTITVEEGAGVGIANSYTIQQTAVAEHFTYREYGTPLLGAWRRVSSPNRLLAYWNTLGLSGQWRIHLEARLKASPTVVFSAGTTVCLDGTLRSSVEVALDQQAPTAVVSVTGYSDATGFHAALPCGDFTRGVTIVGTFDITDNIGVGPYSLQLEPQPTPPAAAVPVNISVDPGSTPTHVFGTWTVATGTLEPCGYVIHLTAWDITIVNCGTSWRDDDTVGFCLRASE
jgi:hypothetical protein